MSSNFQFAFLGHQHNYLARVITINKEGWAQEDAVIEVFGLPRAFENTLRKDQYLRRFITNIRGHDFLSHAGKWTDSERGYAGHNPTALASVLESSVLESLMQENRDNGKDELNMIASYGPRPGSIFVKAFSLRQYRWKNLPDELEVHIQRELSAKGWGDGRGAIHDVAMNAAGGWVILFDEGKRFAYGGPPGAIPPKLEQALDFAKKSKNDDPTLQIAIERIYLNHQNKEEYLLLFKNGWVVASLHHQFKEKLNRLLQIWRMKNRLPVHRLEFLPNAFSCPEPTHSNLNALYYSRRGLFFLSRLNPVLAFKYMQEAIHQYETDMTRDNYALAIIAMYQQRQANGLDRNLSLTIRNRHSRAYDPRSPPRPPEHKDEDTMFRDAFRWMLDEGLDVSALVTRLDEIRRPFLMGNGKRGKNGEVNEWCFEMASADKDGPKELPSPTAERGSVLLHPVHLAELEDSQWVVSMPRVSRTETVVSEMSSTSGREDMAPDVILDGSEKFEEANVWSKSRSMTIMGKFGRGKNRAK